MRNSNSYKWQRAVQICLLATTVLAMAGCKSRQTQSATQPPSYTTAEDAGKALVNASKSGDVTAVANVLGPGATDIVSSGDANEDKQSLSSFVSKYEKMHRWARMTDGSQVLYIGADNYPFPVPVAQANGRWTFNVKAGKDEAIARRIGRNELLAMDASYAIAIAQQAYAAQKQPGEPAQQFASLIVSTPGKYDGLFWKTAPGQQPSPLSELSKYTNVDANPGKPDQMLDGYTFRILTAQGANANGGAASYVKDGKLTGGFAILASPVEYRRSGVMTFLMGPDGVLLEKDLGDKTSQIAAATTAFDPDDTWSQAE